MLHRRVLPWRAITMMQVPLLFPSLIPHRPFTASGSVRWMGRINVAARSCIFLDFLLSFVSMVN